MICKQCGEPIERDEIEAVLKLWHEDVNIDELPKDLCLDCLRDYIWNNQLDGCTNIYED